MIRQIVAFGMSLIFSAVLSAGIARAQTSKPTTAPALRFEISFPQQASSTPLDGHTLKLPPDKGEGQQWQIKPGNLYSKPQKIHLDPKTQQVIRVSLTEKIPPIEEQPAVVDSVLESWTGLAQPKQIADSKWVKHLRIQSDLLTKFWGRPTYLGAIVLLPEGWDEHPHARFPLVVQQTHFHRDISEFVPFRTQPP